MSPPEAEKTDDVLVRFRVGPRWFALPVQEVSQVAPLQPIREVPRTPAFVRGLMEFQGRLLTVLDAVLLLGDGPIGRPAEESLLVLSRPFQNLALAIPGLPSVGPPTPPPAIRSRTAAESPGSGGEPGVLEAEDLVRKCRDGMERFQTASRPPSTTAGG